MVPLGAPLAEAELRRFGAEVVIVGAGPAGAALALRLARLGRDVLVVERSRFPRDKPCGDCLNPGAVEALRRMGIIERVNAAVCPQPLVGWHVEAPDGAAIRTAFGGPAPDGSDGSGWAIRRRDFDAALLAAARANGARTRTAARVVDLLRDGGRRERGGRVVGVVVREGTRSEAIRARFVVGADGLRSVVLRRLGLRERTPRLRKFALVGHLASGVGSDGFGELRVRGGRTCGYAALAGGGNITLVISAREARELRGNPSTFFRAALRAFPEVEERVVRAGLEADIMVTGPFDQPVSRPWALGALLVGDAAGYYDPFTGQGIYQALNSAALAADSILCILESPAHEVELLREYGRRFRRSFEPSRRVQKLIAAVTDRPLLMSRLVRMLSAGNGVAARRLLRVVGDLERPTDLLDPVMWCPPLLHLVRQSVHA